MKKILGLALAGIVLSFSQSSFSQTYAETALLFSQVRPGGSARIQAMGGAQVSLGGDYSSAVSNPAGLGFYNRSEFTITPGISLSSASTNYFGTNGSGSKSSFQIPGISLVLHSDKEGQGGFLGGTFAVTYNRTNDFNRSFSYSGKNSSSSIIDYFINDATGFPPSTLLAPTSSNPNGGDYHDNPTGLAYNNYLLEDSTFFNPNGSNLQYASALGINYANPSDTRSVMQKEDVTTSGAQNQLSIAYGVNFSDKFYLGAGVGLSFLSFQSQRVYQESNYKFDLDPTYNPLLNMRLEENLKTTGTGINASLGIIYRPTDAVQFGASYNSPTFYQLTDNYNANMSTKWNNFDYYGTGNPNDFFNDWSDKTNDVTTPYALQTPSRMNLGMTAFIQRKGFISGDIEFTNYAGATYSTGDGTVDFTTDNATIKANYKNVVNYRLGGEYRFLTNYRARAGYSYMSDPYRSTQNEDRSIQRISGGFGYRNEKLSIDFAIIYSSNNALYTPYTLYSNSPLVSISHSNVTALVTIGFTL